jgi:3-dehydroquinate dehydratase-1
VTVVASTHDFEATPSRERLDDLLAEAAERGDVGKLATTARDRSDTLALLSATHAATTAGRTVATMAMGAPGSHTRAVAPLYGSRIGYAPVDAADATAPGQYDLATLSSLVATLDAEAGKR